MSISCSIHTNVFSNRRFQKRWGRPGSTRYVTCAKLMLGIYHDEICISYMVNAWSCTSLLYMSSFITTFSDDIPDAHQVEGTLIRRTYVLYHYFYARCTGKINTIVHYTNSVRRTKSRFCVSVWCLVLQTSVKQCPADCPSNWHW